MDNIFPCGQCMPCRINRRQEWTFRLLLELRQRAYTYFVTLTYDNEHLPDGNTLVKKDYQDFLKRLRKRLGFKIRYWVTGEYGEKYGRPHYHFLIFSDDFVNVDFDHKGKIIDSEFHKAWTDGSGLIGLVDVHVIPSVGDGLAVARYCAGYVLKKLTTRKSMDRVNDNRLPEFGHGSRRPGIGLDSDSINSITNAMKKIGVAPEHIDYKGVIKSTKDLYMLRLNGKKYPVGRYLRKKLEAKFGNDNRNEFQKALFNNMKKAKNWLEMDSDSEKAKRKETFYRSKKAFDYSKRLKTL